MGTRVSHPVFARIYHWLSAGAEEAGAAEHREDTLRGLRGRVVELGAGTGLNFGHYPSEVTEVVAVEPEPYMRRQAVDAAARTPVPVTVLAGDADHLPLEDESCDAGVASLVLCSVPEQSRALAELFRVIRPGGELRYYEHVRAEAPGHARLQDRVDRVWPILGGGCHPNRDTPDAIRRAGFEVLDERRFHFAPCVLTRPVAPHVIGRARRPWQADR